MPLTWMTVVWKDAGGSGTGLIVPDDVVAALGSGKRPKVVVTLNGYSYRSTVTRYAGVYMLPLAAEHRHAAGVQGGQQVALTLALDTEPRLVDMPADLAAALADVPGARAAFDALAYTHRKEHVRSINEAKAHATRERRIAAVVAALKLT